MKRLFKNKKGDFSFFALLIVPVFLLIFTSILVTNYKKNSISTKMQTAVDNISLLASNYYADDVSTDFDNKCHFDETLLNNNTPDDENIVINISGEEYYEEDDSFLYYFNNYFKNIDGFNEYWSATLTLNKKELTDILEIKIYYIFPKVPNSMKVLANFGKDTLNGATGWYSKNSLTWNNISSEIKEKVNSIESNCSISKWKKLNDKADVIAGVAIAKTSCI